MKKQLKTILCLSLCLSGSASASLAVSIGGSSAQSALGVAIKAVSRSLSSTSEGASSSSGSSSKKKEKGYVLDLDFVTQPNLFASIHSTSKIIYEKNIRLAQKKWLNACLSKIDFPYHSGTLTIRKSKHPLQKRKKVDALIVGNSFYISESVFESQNTASIKNALAEKSWQHIGTINRERYAEISGWKAHSFVPVLKVNSTQFSHSPTLAMSPKENYIQSLLKPKKQPSNSSEAVFLNQLVGGAYQIPASELDAYTFEFCYVEDKGFAGASQGHCALVVKTPEGKRFSFAYSADFDFDTPVLSASKALFGSLPRKIDCLRYQDLKSVYLSENRETRLERIPLNRTQKNNLLFRLRECMQYENGSYSFFRQNCANPLRDILLYGLPNDKKLHGWKTPQTLWNWSKELGENA